VRGTGKGNQNCGKGSERDECTRRCGVSEQARKGGGRWRCVWSRGKRSDVVGLWLWACGQRVATRGGSQSRATSVGLGKKKLWCPFSKTSGWGRGQPAPGQTPKQWWCKTSLQGAGHGGGTTCGGGLGCTKRKKCTRLGGGVCAGHKGKARARSPGGVWGRKNDGRGYATAKIAPSLWLRGKTKEGKRGQAEGDKRKRGGHRLESASDRLVGCGQPNKGGAPEGQAKTNEKKKKKVCWESVRDVGFCGGGVGGGGEGVGGVAKNQRVGEKKKASSVEKKKKEERKKPRHSKGGQQKKRPKTREGGGKGRGKWKLQGARRMCGGVGLGGWAQKKKKKGGGSRVKGRQGRQKVGCGSGCGRERGTAPQTRLAAGTKTVVVVCGQGLVVCWPLGGGQPANGRTRTRGGGSGARSRGHGGLSRRGQPPQREELAFCGAG